MATTNSILLYGAEIWADAMKVNKYKKRMVAVQRRGALRVACAYRTVSEEAVAVIAGTIPIDLLARERKQIYDSWHERWRTATKGRWTYLLIHDITKWLGREYGEVNFYLTQFLTGHGYFRYYLFKLGNVSTPECKYCGHE